MHERLGGKPSEIKTTKELEPDALIVMIYCISPSTGEEFRKKLAKALARHSGPAAGEWILMVVNDVGALGDADLTILISKLPEGTPNQVGVIDQSGATQPTAGVIQAIKEAAAAKLTSPPRSSSPQ